ncbi:MAG TPA: hypothetical protein V6D25_25665 [Leptolyngbyaceae cyanobacterium]
MRIFFIPNFGKQYATANNSIDQVIGFCLKQELLTAIVEGHHNHKVSTMARN